MRRVALLLALSLLAFASTASAQNLPGGTWRETCRDPSMRGDTLTKPTVSDLLEKEGRRGTVIAPGTDGSTPDIRPGLGGGPLPSPG